MSDLARLGAALLATLTVAGCPGTWTNPVGNDGDGGGAAISQDLSAPADAASAPDLATPVDLGPGVQTARPKGSTAAALGYYEFLPPGYDLGTQPVPLLLFFHGIDQGGDGTTQLSRVLAAGPPMLIDQGRWPTSRPFVVLSPQHGDTSSCFTAEEIRDFLTYALAHYRVDTARVYLTGLSCGAIGLWNYLGLEQSRVTAAVPIAGNGIGAWNTAGCKLGQVALWAFHGDADPRVSVDGTNVPIDNLLSQCPAPPRVETKKTIYPGVGHDSWDMTYDLSAGNDPFTWLLSKTR